MRTRGMVKALSMGLAAGMVAALTGCNVGESASTQPQPSFSWPTALPSASTPAPGTPSPSFDAERFTPPAVSTAALKAEFAYDPTASLQLNINSTADDLADGVAIQSMLYIVRHRRVTAQVVMPETRPADAPGLVLAHGGAPDPDAWRAEAIALAKKGYVSILPDIPMTVTGNAADDIDYFKYAVIAERRAIDILLAEQLVSPKRIAFVGHSWGGDLAEIMAGVEPRLSAVVVVSGSSRVATDMIMMGQPGDAAGFMSKVSIFDGYRYLALPGHRRVLIQFGRQDGSIPDAQRDELTKSTYGPHSRKDYDAGHDLINFAPAAADRAAFLAAALS